MHSVISPSILYWGTPIVLITTENEDGTFNICPMSSAWWLSHRCMLGLAAMQHTTKNLLRTRQCVLNLATDDLMDQINLLSRTTGSDPLPEWKVGAGYIHVKDKFKHAGLTPQPSDLVGPPRILECAVQMEAEFVGSHDMMKDMSGRGGSLLGLEVKILRVHVEDRLRLAGHENRIDADKWKPMFMCFQEYYGVGQKMSGSSRLAEIDEEIYRPWTKSDAAEE